MEKPLLKFDSSWDDGERDDIRIAGILKFHKLVGTFYIPTICDLSAVDINVFLGEFDIGGHTVYHPPDIKKLDYDRVLYELMENKRWLESILDRKITRFAYPRGRYNEETIKALKESGYREARTTVIDN
jgi:peptidoglycan/xylan/chitin deacetylase (PgdA/CDA1 family)